MAQPFSMRYLLVDGQGNFGSVDGDAPAAMRYTEVRMSRIAQRAARRHRQGNRRLRPELRRVRERAVGAADARAEPAGQRLVRHRGRHGDQHPAAQPGRGRQRLRRAASTTRRSRSRELMEHVPGPDFPTAGIINGARGIDDAYTTGRGRIVGARRRPTSRTYDDNGREAIIVTELPYQVNKARLIERIAELVRDKKIEGISELRDESDKDGMRVVIELKRGENAEIVLNNLYKQTPMEIGVRHQHGGAARRPAAAAQPQGDARGVRPPPPRSGHAPHGVRPAQGARARPHPRRPGGRAGQHRRGHRADQGLADAGRSARRR